MFQAKACGHREIKASFLGLPIAVHQPVGNAVGCRDLGALPLINTVLELRIYLALIPLLGA